VRFDPNGLAVIAGCGGFGLAAAGWLAERGARRIVLASRSGRATSDGEKTLGELRRDGVTVTIEACDVADRKDLADLLDRLRAQGPIRTVVHAAMVLDDAPLRELDGKRMLNVLRPKVLGASHLDRLTRDDPIEHFLLFTSIAAVIGNPGQAVYAAANGYLEGLAAARREAGLPALAIAWGAITDTGYLARQAGSVEVLARRAGAERFAARHALGLLDTLMRCDGGGVAEAVQVLAPMNWSKARQALPLFESPAFSHLAREADETQPSDAGRIDLAAAVSELDPAAAHALVVRLVTTEVASIFRMPEADINPARPLTELGMDSLMGLELRMKAQRSLGVDIPLVSVGGGLSIDAIASKIIARLGRAETAAGLLQSDAALATRHVSLEGMDTDALQRIAESVEERRAGMERVL
jgi:NAD(P)-dependent dehydrogenase (short-subunit alcohol dehydrogenase family)/acyl carrier protein